MTTVRRALVAVIVGMAVLGLVLLLVYAFVGIGEGSGGSDTGNVLTTTTG